MANKAENVNAVIAGRYQLQGKLGQGGMGSAYRALDRVTGRVVALKQLDDPTPKFSALFEREYYTLASLRHPCVVEVYDFGITIAAYAYLDWFVDDTYQESGLSFRRRQAIEAGGSRRMRHSDRVSQRPPVGEQG